MLEATPQAVYALLEDLRIPFEALHHEAIFSVRDTSIVLPGQQVKNLLLKTKKARQFYLVIAHDEKTIDLKRLAESLNEKRLSFANEEEMKNLMHCLPGSLTPFGLVFDKNRHIRVIVDEAVDTTTTVGFHPFINTETLNIAYTDFERFVQYAHHSIERFYLGEASCI